MWIYVGPTQSGYFPPPHGCLCGLRRRGRLRFPNSVSLSVRAPSQLVVALWRSRRNRVVVGVAVDGGWEEGSERIMFLNFYFYKLNKNKYQLIFISN